MPTPTGMARRGDILVAPNNRRWKVVERLGNDCIYAVKLVPADNGPLPPNSVSRGYMILTETPYWLKQGWKFEGA